MTTHWYTISKQEEKLEKLCEYCGCTEYGITEVNTAPHNLCEGCRCEQAKENYYEEIGRDYDEDDENLGIPEEGTMTNLERFRRREIMLHTPTQELYDRLMRWCETQGMYWREGCDVMERNYYESYYNNTYIQCENNDMLSFGDIHGTGKGRTIITLTNKDFEEEHQMTKEDLKIGMVVELRNENKMFPVINKDIEALHGIDNDDSYGLSTWNQDLTDKSCSDYDITKVYTTSDLVSVLSGNYDSLELIWSRENPELIAIKANVAKMEAELENMKESLRKMEEM